MSNILSLIIACGNGPGLLPPLPGAWSGADEFACWAKTQGHTTIQFSDRDGSRFTAFDIAKRLEPHIDQQSLSELFVYFAGHGACFDWDHDYWLLRKENAAGGDVIDVAATIDLARRAGVSRVVLISDACRTVFTKEDFGLNRIALPILPLRQFDAVSVTVDRFLAAGPGTAALEVRDRERAANSYGVFTKYLLNALRGSVSELTERNDRGNKMVIKPGRLKLYLEDVVPREAGAISNGYPQRPDCRTESSMPLAVVGDVAELKITISTMTFDGHPIESSRINLSYHKGLDNWETLSERSGPTAFFTAPSGLIYKTTAFAETPLLPQQPMPVFELNSDVSGLFVTEPNLVDSTVENTGYRATGSANARFAVTRVIDDAGKMHHEAPSAGVFRVVTYDPLTTDMATGLQEFSGGARIPSPIPTSNRTFDVEQKIVDTAKLHGRRSFETRTGLTIFGALPQEQISVNGAPGLLDAVFPEDGNLQIRGNHSGSVVVRLPGEHFVPLAIFKDLVGSVRLGSIGKTAPTVADLSYAPAANSRFDFDLQTFQYNHDLVSGNARDELDALQLLAVACARKGFFDVTIDKSNDLANRMRQLKHHNPIFGVLAGYAYSQIRRTDQIVDMIRWFIRKDQSIPFDLVMLSRLNESDILSLIKEMRGQWAIDASQSLQNWVVPCWPMLTQGWAELPSSHLRRFPVLEEAQKSLVPGFWTTIFGEPGDKIARAVTNGEFKWI